MLWNCTPWPRGFLNCACMGLTLSRHMLYHTSSWATSSSFSENALRDISISMCLTTGTTLVHKHEFSLAGKPPMQNLWTEKWCADHDGCKHILHEKHCRDRTGERATERTNTLLQTGCCHVLCICTRLFWQHRLSFCMMHRAWRVGLCVNTYPQTGMQWRYQARYLFCECICKAMLHFTSFTV